MIGGFQNLSLSTLRAQQDKTRFQRWQELEARLSDQVSDEEEELEQAQPRVVFSEELQRIVDSPAPDIIPKLSDPCTALVLWRPPVLPPPESALSPAEPAAEPAPEEPPPSASPAPQHTAYDFSAFGPPAVAGPPQAFPFGAAGVPTADSALFLFGGGGAGGETDSTAPSEFSRCMAAPLPADDEAMEL